MWICKYSQRSISKVIPLVIPLNSRQLHSLGILNRRGKGLATEFYISVIRENLYCNGSCNNPHRRFSSKKNSESEPSEQEESQDAVEQTEDGGNTTEASNYKSFLDSTRLIFQSLGKQSKIKKHGRQVQDGKIRKKPIPIKTDSLDAKNEQAIIDEEDVKQDNPGEKGHTVHFTLPILHFKSTARFHALPALGLYRKPAFPGFYQVLQIQDQAVLQCLSQVKQNAGHDYIGGFLTRDDLSKDLNGQSLPTLRDDAGAVVSIDDLHSIGTLLQIITITPHMSLHGGQVILMPHKRIKLTGIHAEPCDTNPLYKVAVEYIEDQAKQFDDSNVTKALHLEIITTVKELIKTSNFYKEHFDQIIRFYNLDYPTRLADLIAGISLAKRDQLQAILSEMDIDKRLSMVLEVAKNDLEFAKVQVEVKSQIEEKLSKEQRKYILMEQMKMIKRELGIDTDDKNSVVEAFEAEFANIEKFMSEEAISSFKNSVARLKQLEISSAEFGVARSYLEWLVGLPWGKATLESRNLQVAKEVLDKHHFGLKDVKGRLLEYMATGILRGKSYGKIICLVGPPGVGKTSIAISMAEALNRKMYRFSLGGLFDVAELRGHRRTYVGALPGKFVQALKYTGTMNPLIILDEIDKLGRDARGDPASALLEVLDPSQNSTFRDHYLDVSIDLSQVLFICTANSTDTIPVPLLDRMEIITIPGYLPEEKIAISKNHLIPSIQSSTGVSEALLHIEDSALQHIITHYSREAGVRALEKCIEKIFRKVALQVVMKECNSVALQEGTFDVNAQTKMEITSTDISQYLGVALYTRETLHPYPLPFGVVMGLAWTNAGGATMYVEAHGQLLDKTGNVIEPNRSESIQSDHSVANLNLGGGSLKVTGQLGSVMTESSQIALTFAKSFLRQIQPNNLFLNEAHLHIHVPEGATPKDGPSGGITMTCALVSLAAKKRIKKNLAMTGELTLSGKVLRVGGIKEKLIAAIRENLETVILPKANEPDFVELDESIKNKINIVLVDNFNDVYNAVFEHDLE
ncbi:bifunctional P-loop containing nucleoside triphosphate hydrolase/Lon protease/Ribosomal protein S5 domain 2-type fold [Babesia duncani]|uniref:endopeptidase La n=1 Tax=Babesia duncani TaxID=323732 RepID=A0AAD9PKZ9_9APIC|nr:bifunctional P-loop containing nucleoside triphosphate hydrolase/Lon protease/Ribosomal protein S5 domain 2-type fold [Babesia duncani]